MSKEANSLFLYTSIRSSQIITYCNCNRYTYNYMVSEITYYCIGHHSNQIQTSRLNTLLLDFAASLVVHVVYKLKYSFCPTNFSI